MPVGDRRREECRWRGRQWTGANAVRAKAGKKGGNIAGVRERESASRAVVMEGEAKELGRDGVGFAVIQGGKTIDKKLKIKEVVVFDTEVIYHQDKGYRTRDVTEKERGKGFEETVGSKVGDEPILRKLAGLLKSVHRFVDAEKEVGRSQEVGLDEGLKGEARKNKVGEEMGVDLYELGDRKRSAKIKIDQVNGAEERVSGDDRIKEEVDGREGSYKGGGGNGGFKAVAAGRASHAPVDPRGEAAEG